MKLLRFIGEKYGNKVLCVEHTIKLIKQADKENLKFLIEPCYAWFDDKCQHCGKQNS